MKPDLKDLHPETQAVRARTPASGHREHASAIYMTSSFLFDDAEHARALFAKEVEGQVYTRYTNPSVDEFVEKMCLLEEDRIRGPSVQGAVRAPGIVELEVPVDPGVQVFRRLVSPQEHVPGT
jgi:O-succinylhomoserine sulfhydrylase